MKWRMYYEKRGGHVHCRLFCGMKEGALGKCGDLCFREEEFTEFTYVYQCLPIEFRREMDADGNPAGDSDVRFKSGGTP